MQCFTPSTRSVGEIVDIFNDKKKSSFDHTITAVERISVKSTEKRFNSVSERRTSLSNDLQGNALLTDV